MTRHSTARSALRRGLALGSALALCATGTVLTATAAHAETAPAPNTEFVDGRYIVVLQEDALATYEGGIQGLAPTAPQRGQDLDVRSGAARAYAAHLNDRQADVAASVGATVEVELTNTLNGFVADLTSEQADELSRTPGVRAVERDTLQQLTSSPANDFLHYPELWESVGGEADAGAGVVVGVLDTGIAPENPFFAGEPLGTTPGAEPYLDGETIVYEKADGNTFTGVCQEGSGFTAEDCSTKIVGARYYLDGFGAANIGTETQVPGEYASPRDGDGHGSHTASTAAGNANVPIHTDAGVDLGTMSGVAPAARIAAYKVCWNGPDLESTEDDGCASSDLVAAIDQAVADGVDVINYSIGGGAAPSVVTATDLSFLGAAASGVFVAASAGNSGPDASTLDHASPWYTTVAASTVPNYEATVTLEDGSAFAGGSSTFESGESVSGTFVYAGDIPASGASAEDAALCLPDTLDAAAVAGNIVLCDRGVNARVEKSQVVADAGGIGAVLVNVTPGSIDLDDHAVPTVHLDSADQAPVLAAAQAREQVTLSEGNSTGVETPAPVIAGFSSRGPATADGSDVIKPDIAAPGVGIVAGSYNAPGAEGRFEFLSGTSMAAPHVAGLAAVYLSEHPLATPAEVKSALMTTATDTVTTEGERVTDPWAQGAGNVSSPAFMSPGLYYANDTEDWFGYLRGLGYGLPDSWVGEAMDPSDLNLASIGIGALAGTQTVTRTLTALEPGSYEVSVEGVPGVDVSVSPTTLDFTEAGQELSYTVSFETTTATPNEWSTGFLTWESSEHSVRSPIAVRPLALDVPQWVEGEGNRTGAVTIEGVAGTTGTLTTDFAGFSRYETLGEDSGLADDQLVYPVTIRDGELVHDFVLQGDDEVADLDLYLQRLDAAGEPVEQWVSGTAGADEAITLEDPEPGEYRAIVVVYSVSGDVSTPFLLEHASVTQNDHRGKVTITPATQDVTVGEPFLVMVGWKNLPANDQYLGVVLMTVGGHEVRSYVYTETTGGPAWTRPSAP